ncbi:DUF4429 domain-containing protein [Streptomyces antimicrobicus]|uniref:DUF4429 domain-containing protein n=1 Tax=Streptomyces antimicrobicus TaxID=2883108 RepID=A0ABS8B8H6_9ACTN|nr:DUF4429 domain-containing protein [Streptomyces antimicrobicus]MCB5180920.1 DUF4429 domain-containing protein [Streptomyces antimicrobicus]
MGDVLAGNHAVWEFDSDSVLIRFERGIRTPRLWSALGRRRVPVEALAEVTVTPGKRDTLVLRAVPRPGADPLTEVAAGQLKESLDPYRLVLPADRAPRARELAEALAAAVRATGTATEPAERFLVAVPEPPLQLKAHDARATFDGQAVSLRWSRTGASSTKWKAGDRHYPLSELRGVAWHSPDAPGGHLRLLLRDAQDGVAPPPDQDPAAVLFALGHGAVHESLPFAAAVLAAVRSRTPVAAVPEPSDRMRHLGELHGAGLLTDAEYAALRDRFAAEA